MGRTTVERGDDDPGLVADTAGLGLVPFCPLSHASRGREDPRQGGDRDDQVVIVRDGVREIRAG